MEETGKKRNWRALRLLAGGGAVLAFSLVPAVHANPSHASKAGGTIAYQQGNVPDCYDPDKTAQSASYQVFSYVVDSLLTEDKKGKLIGNLATKWKVANGGKLITFTLRKGVKFSNGDPFTAAAVKYTFDRALNPATKSPATASDLTAITQTKVINPSTVQLVLKTPNRPLMTNLTVEYTGILDPKATQAEGAGSCQKPIGTGPYMVQSVGPSFATTTLVRNPYRNWEPSWSKNQGKPYISKIVFKPIAQAATAVSELLSGGVDISAVDGTQIARVQNNKSVYLKKVKSQGEDYLGFNTAHAPFNNVDVRRAVAEVIDRSAIIKVAYNGLAAPAYSAVPATLPYYDKKAKSYAPKLDVADATKIIAANHATGPYDLLIFQGSSEQATAELIQGELAQAGMKVNIDAKQLGDFISTAGKGNYDILTIGWGWPDPDFLYSLFQSSQGHGAGLNWTNYVNPTLDKLFDQQRTTTNPKKVQVIWNQIQKILSTQVICVPTVIPASIYGIRTRVKGWNINKAGKLNLADLYVTGS
jgi:peptide/nickel transport system substrate-binding protein